MGIISPTFGSKTAKKNFDKTCLSKALLEALNDEVETPQGTMTYYQGIAKRLVNTAFLAESNKDANQAAKIIFEQTVGRAPVAGSDKVKELPQMVISLRDSSEKKQLEERAMAAESDEEYFGEEYAEGFEAEISDYEGDTVLFRDGE